MVGTIFLVRHGEAKSNVEKYFAGWSADSPLTHLGREQARVLRKRLSREGITKIFCSDSPRARETALLLRLGCPIAYSKDLRERNYGDMEGVKWGADEEKYEAYHSDPFMRPKNGENCAEVQRRVVRYFRQSVFASKEEKVLVVSHHGPLVLFACHMLGMPLKKWRALRLGNCGLSIFTPEGRNWRLKLWNSLSHFGLQNFAPLFSNEEKVPAGIRR